MALNFSHLCMKPSEVDMLLYHGDCVDGFASAFAGYYFMRTKNQRKKISFIPCQHQKPPPIVSGKNVLLCDFSYKAPILKQLLANSNKLCILDHHVSAEKDLKEIPAKHKVFNKAHSGAYITWAYFFGEETVPLMIKYIEDNDIWRKAMPNTKAFTSYVFNMPKTFELYEKMLDDSHVHSVVIPVGDGMSKQNDTYIMDGVKKAAVHLMLIDSRLYFVATVNTSILKSEIGNTLFFHNPNINFACCYSKNPYTGETFISLRSIDSATDVEVIASRIGGGGHRNAAGVSLFNSDMLPGLLIDRYQCFDLINHIKLCSQTLIDNETSVNIVYLNSSHHKRHLGKYLLQTRYDEMYEGETRSISEANSIIRNRTKDMTFYMGLDLAAIYVYDDSNNRTYFSIQSDNSDLLHMIKDIYKKYVVDTDDTNIYQRLKLSFDGFCNKLK